MLEEIENQKIEKRLTTVEVLLKDTREDVGEIKNRVQNELPHQIDNLKDKINERIDNLKDKLLIGFTITIAASIIAQIVLKFYK